MFSRCRHFDENLDFHQKSQNLRKTINVAFPRFGGESHILREMGPGAPKTPKKGWNCIGFIRPGASGPRGTKKAKSCENRAIYFAFSLEFLILCKKLGIPGKSPFCTFPERCANQWFNGPFSRCPSRFQDAPPTLAKRVEFNPF